MSAGHPFNLPTTLLGGEAFISLAELVTDLTEQKDVTNDVGMTYTEMANLVDAFGLPTMIKLARKNKLDVSASSLMYAVPLSKIKALSDPVVISRSFVDEIGSLEGEADYVSNDQTIITNLVKGFTDISKNMVKGGIIVNDVSASLGPGYEFPRGTKLDVINWLDISAVIGAKNLRFDSTSSVTDISAVHKLFMQSDVDGVQRTASYVTAVGSAAGVAFGDSATDYAERSRDYLNFLNLMSPIPPFSEIKNMVAKTDVSFYVAPYLEAGLFKNEVGAGKTYLSTAEDFKKEIRLGSAGSINSAHVTQQTTKAVTSASLINEFSIMKAYGFSASKVSAAYATELALGLNTNGKAAANAAAGLDNVNTIQSEFAAVFGNTGGLVDQVTDYGAIEVFDNTEGFKFDDISRATGISSFADYVAQIKAFIESDPDFTWSSKGIVAPLTYAGSAKEKWDKHKNRLASDPRLPNYTPLSAAQDEKLRILLETTKDPDICGGSYTKNDISFSLGTDGAILNDKGHLVHPDETTALGNSIWRLAEKHGWTDLKDVIGDRHGSALFMMDNAYNVRSRIPQLDIVGGSAVSDTEFADLRNPAKAAGRRAVYKNRAHQTLAQDSANGYEKGQASKPVGEFFTPAHFQAMFFDYSDLQHTANVALRYFDLSNSGTDATDLSKNVIIVNGVTTFRQTFRHLDQTENTEAVPSYNADISGAYSSTNQMNQLDWVYGVLVKGSYTNARDALAQITSWRPVPVSIYVDASDVTGYIAPATRKAQADAAGVDSYDATVDGTYDNRNLPGCMVHVMANYLIRRSDGSHPLIESHELIDLLELHPDEAIKALSAVTTGNDVGTTNDRLLNTINRWTGTATDTENVNTNVDVEQLTRNILKLLVVYGKSVGLFNTLLGTKGVRVAVDAYEEEVVKWADVTNNDLAVFGSGASAFLANQHLAYWIPYLQQFTPAELAEEVRKDDDLLNTSALSQTLRLGLLLAATKGHLASAAAAGDASRIAGLNAFFAAGVPKAFVDLAWTAKGTNQFTNLAGSNYE